MYKIFIIEDDIKMCKLIKESLKKWSYDVKQVYDFKDILKEFTEYMPHLVLLDINLPFYDGFYWCNKIRNISTIPIIFISSRDTDMDKIMGITLGGDDYIQKPFSIDFLTAKIQAILRRTYAYRDENLNLIQHKDMILNLEECALYYKNNKYPLSPNENKILSLLMKNGGKVVKRDRIMQSLWDDENFVDDNTLTVNVNRLRKKLSQIGLKDVIETIKSEGYKLK